jgi:hypothetical protein
VLLRGFGDLLNQTTQENTTFAKEFSDRVRVIACLTKLPNIIHSDMPHPTRSPAAIGSTSAGVCGPSTATR